MGATTTHLIHHADEHAEHGANSAERAPAEPGYPEHPELSAGAGAADEVHAPVAEHSAHAQQHHGHPTGSQHEAYADHATRDKHAGHSVAMFRDKFWISLALTIPTLVWGHMLQGALGYTAPRFTGSSWIPAIFGTAVFLYGGWVFISEAPDAPVEEVHALESGRCGRQRIGAAPT